MHRLTFHYIFSSKVGGGGLEDGQMQGTVENRVQKRDRYRVLVEMEIHWTDLY
jgi:hypothetical protein